MISNNSNIKIKKIELDQVEDNDDSDDYEIDNAELELTKGKSDLRLQMCIRERYGSYSGCGL